jgi:hypothetical protein
MGKLRVAMKADLHFLRRTGALAKLLIHFSHSIIDLFDFSVTGNYPKGFVRFAGQFRPKS